MDDDSWTVFDDEQVRMELEGLRHPLTVALEFVKALAAPVLDTAWLQQLVTPESLKHWGDFSSAKGVYDSIENPGFGSTINQPKGAPDVGYFKVLSGVTEGFTVSEPTPMLVPAVATLVWRPEAGLVEQSGMWLVHQFGEPADLGSLGHVRTSLGRGPSF
ncbi:hypothetical protein [Curtobacterium sp. KBS0715]|uniref:hypothetical protein n=1 Tax=Curtobacterium sp. KBS0715 TaxID=1179671 RepID=UPI00110D3E2D|nr:hypothetical protein [Curtobacterium sp. KBS0715]TSD11626.1 hypothetical protein FFG40_008815 [Curtobacterium sp. KBS0715]